MEIKSLELQNFRNYPELKVEFDQKTNIIYGDNAQGKTNLLESIYVLGLTKSHRSFIDNNLINNEDISPCSKCDPNTRAACCGCPEYAEFQAKHAK